MKLGVTYNQIFSVEELAKYGFDFLELPIQWLHALTPKGQDAFLEEIKKYNLTADSCCSFFGKEVALMGDDVDLHQIEQVTRKNVELADKFGIKVVVIGSGEARKIPEGFSKEAAIERFSQVVKTCADICAEKGMQMVSNPCAALKPTLSIPLWTDWR